eukprot:7624946-Alexandrium_andersonii.AAC.1
MRQRRTTAPNSKCKAESHEASWLARDALAQPTARTSGTCRRKEPGCSLLVWIALAPKQPSTSG